MKDFVTSNETLFYEHLSRERNVVPFLEYNLDKVNWNALSTNENAIHILEKNVIKSIGPIYPETKMPYSCSNRI